MNVHKQLAVKHRQLRMLVKGHELLIQAVACRTDNLNRTITLYALLQRADRGDGG